MASAKNMALPELGNGNEVRNGIQTKITKTQISKKLKLLLSILTRVAAVISNSYLVLFFSLIYL